MSTYTHYDILRVPEDADDKEIKAAYKQAVLDYHPDHMPTGVSKRMREDAAETWSQIQEAFAVLGDPESREEYDTLLEEMRRSEEAEKQFEPSTPPPAPPKPKPTPASRTHMNLSCGKCKSIRSFSGQPPTCDECGWVCRSVPQATPQQQPAPDEPSPPQATPSGRLDRAPSGKEQVKTMSDAARLYFEKLEAQERESQKLYDEIRRQWLAKGVLAEVKEASAPKTGDSGPSEGKLFKVPEGQPRDFWDAIAQRRPRHPKRGGHFVLGLILSYIALAFIIALISNGINRDSITIVYVAFVLVSMTAYISYTVVKVLEERRAKRRGS